MIEELKETACPTSRRTFLRRAGQAGIAVGLAHAFAPMLTAYPQEGSTPSDKLIVRSRNPQDLETPPELMETWITPNDVFYVRSHMYTPKVEINDWRLQIDGAVGHPLTLTLDDLKKFPQSMQVVTLECSGNGRAFYDPPMAGAQWEKGAVGNAKWTGARLSDVLNHAGVKPDGKFLTVDGADKPMAKMPDFIRSVPIEKAMHPDTLLAYQMNGESIPISHGYPLRMIVPGWTGNNNVKWVTHITLTDKVDEGFFMKTAYKKPSVSVAPGSTVDPSLMVSLTGLAVKSTITSPKNGTQFKRGPVAARGVAYAGEADIVAVDVSTDLGRTWNQATLGKDRARYAWRLWEYRWDATEPGSLLIMSRARDSAGRVQPMVQDWNPSGYLWNAVDRVRVNVVNG
jgi:DMSO/TMAO reductase YedYZ molybdopterin-dependent catalytic subunit